MLKFQLFSLVNTPTHSSLRAVSVLALLMVVPVALAGGRDGIAIEGGILRYFASKKPGGQGVAIWEPPFVSPTLLETGEQHYPYGFITPPIDSYIAHFQKVGRNTFTADELAILQQKLDKGWGAAWKALYHRAGSVLVKQVDPDTLVFAGPVHQIKDFRTAWMQFLELRNETIARVNKGVEVGSPQWGLALCCDPKFAFEFMATSEIPRVVGLTEEAHVWLSHENSALAARFQNFHVGRARLKGKAIEPGQYNFTNSIVIGREGLNLEQAFTIYDYESLTYEPTTLEALLEVVKAPIKHLPGSLGDIPHFGPGRRVRREWP